MKYLMLVCRDPAIELTPEQRAAMRDSVIAWVDEMEGRGILLPGGHELRPVSDARTVRIRRGEVLISDGPFAETKEQIGGVRRPGLRQLGRGAGGGGQAPGGSARCDRRALVLGI